MAKKTLTISTTDRGLDTIVVHATAEAGLALVRQVMPALVDLDRRLRK